MPLASGEMQQPKDVQPQHAHKVPVPACNFYHQLARLEPVLDPRPPAGKEQGYYVSSQMDSVCPGQNKEERAAGTGPEKQALRFEAAPHHSLSRQKPECQKKRDRQPW